MAHEGTWEEVQVSIDQLLEVAEPTAAHHRLLRTLIHREDLLKQESADLS